MPEEFSHHQSKKREYDFLVVPTDDAGKTKRVRLSPGLIGAVLGGSVGLIVATVLLLLVYTPLGPLVPIPNPELENRYNRELLSIKQRMSDLMAEQIQLRAYVVKVRQAFGEKVALNDSGTIVERGDRRRGPGKQQASEKSTTGHAMNPDAIGPSVSTVVDRGKSEQTGGVVLPVIMPTTGYLSRGFDPNQRHFGMDIAGKTGTPINAGADGYVIFSGWNNEDGYVLIISHAGGFLTYYKHNQSLLKSANSFVKRGEPVALMGNSGVTSSGPHLHFEVWKEGVPVDPQVYIVNLHF
jgi:murein DD-endopeptidase MepM/ murein hydrolase activator NlpD